MRAADGQFFYSVRTTGVYCRPSCAARVARPENVAFHATAAEAPSGRLPPLQALQARPAFARGRSKQTAAMVARLCRFIETAEHAPTLDELAQRARLSPYHLHRVFKAATGVTPEGLRRAHRARRVRDELARSGSVTEAIYDAGYNSSGRFYAQADQVLGMTPTRYRAGGADTEIRFAIGECSLGSILVAAASAASAPSCSATIPTRWRAICRTASRRPR